MPDQSTSRFCICGEAFPPLPSHFTPSEPRTSAASAASLCVFVQGPTHFTITLDRYFLYFDGRIYPTIKPGPRCSKTKKR